MDCFLSGWRHADNVSLLGVFPLHGAGGVFSWLLAHNKQRYMYDHSTAVTDRLDTVFAEDQQSSFVFLGDEHEVSVGHEGSKHCVSGTRIGRLL